MATSRYVSAREQAQLLRAREATQGARTAITAVLRDLDLLPGSDFTVHQLKQKNKVIGVRVYLQSLGAEETVYNQAAVIEALTSEGEFPFKVSTYTTRSGQHLSDISWEM